MGYWGRERSGVLSLLKCAIIVVAKGWLGPAGVICSRMAKEAIISIFGTIPYREEIEM